jgi:hypothetical protein
MIENFFQVRKINKRIWIVNDFTNEKYTIPDWLRDKVPHRQAYQELADDVNRTDYIDALLRFYEKWNKVD